MIVYYDQTGRRTGSLDEGYPAPKSTTDRLKSSKAIFADLPFSYPLDDAFWYYPGGVPTVRPRLDVEVTQKGMAATIKGIPAGTVVLVQGSHGGEIVADDQPTTLTFSDSGRYTVSFEAFPYQRVTIYLDAKG